MGCQFATDGDPGSEEQTDHRPTVRDFADFRGFTKAQLAEPHTLRAVWANADNAQAISATGAGESERAIGGEGRHLSAGNYAVLRLSRNIFFYNCALVPSR